MKLEELCDCTLTKESTLVVIFKADGEEKGLVIDIATPNCGAELIKYSCSDTCIHIRYKTFHREIGIFKNAWIKPHKIVEVNHNIIIAQVTDDEIGIIRRNDAENYAMLIDEKDVIFDV